MPLNFNTPFKIKPILKIHSLKSRICGVGRKLSVSINRYSLGKIKQKKITFQNSDVRNGNNYT